MVCLVLLLRHPVRHIPRLKDTLDSKRVKIEIDAILSVLYSNSFRYLKNELDKDFIYKIFFGSSIFPYFWASFVKKNNFKKYLFNINFLRS